MFTAAGLVFLPRDPLKAACARRLVATSLAVHGFDVEQWTPVASRPDLFRVLVTERVAFADRDVRLARARTETEQRAVDYMLEGFRIDIEPLNREVVRRVRRRKNRRRFVDERHVAVAR